MPSTVLRTVACCLVLVTVAGQQTVVFGDDAPASGCRCIPMPDCPAFRLPPGQRMTFQLASRLRAAKCGFMGSTLKVCCPGGTPTATPAPTTVRPRPTPSSFAGGIPTDLPLSCGVATELDRIHGGENAPLGAYPWMAALGYRVASGGSSSVEFLCGGSLVTRQHVVTAAHCVPPEGHSLKQINLGDWNTVTDPDCETINGRPRCAPPATVRRVATITTHPQYNSVGRYDNDVAVIRLDQPVEFGAYIQPICIPHSFDPNLRHWSRAPDSIAIGWGITEKGTNSPTLQRVRLPLVDIDSCNRTYVGLLWGNQVCAGGRQGQDSCRGDSGGPLITTGVDSPSFQLVGLTSFGKTLCGKEGSPGVYTAVSNYRNWIVDTLPL